MVKQKIRKAARAGYKLHKQIKNDYLFGEDMSDAEYCKLWLSVLLFTPFLIMGTWLMYAALQALTGLR